MPNARIEQQQATDDVNGCLAAKELATATPAEGAAGAAAVGSPNRIEGALLEQCEREYQKVGWWKGPHATPEARQAVRTFWVGLGEPGVCWLAQRIGRESHVDLLDGVTNLLISFGPAGLPLILNTLQGDVTPVQAEHLLTVLRWTRLTGQEHLQPQLNAVLRHFLAHESAEVRQAAVRAARALPRDRARQMLLERRAAEPDPEVAEAIAEELDD